MIHHGDCLEVMAAMEPESVDAIVTDPPYGLEFMGKKWDRLWTKREPSDPAKMAAITARTGRHAGHSDPFISARVNRYEGGKAAQEWHEAWAREAFRVAKPSAYLLAFGGTRTVHRMICAIEDAGWIIRDMLVWAYASGFPKSKASLKPAWEPIVMARKPGPLRMLAVDACRIGYISEDDRLDTAGRNATRHKDRPLGAATFDIARPAGDLTNPLGRWPANVILTDPIFDGDTPGVVGGGEQATHPGTMRTDASPGGFMGETVRLAGTVLSQADSGTYSRFFLIPKADRADREPTVPGRTTERVVSVWGGDEDDLTAGKKSTIARRNHHPTVKPVDLMRHLVRLVTPAGGIVLDPFLGSGTTGLAAELEGFPWIGIEKEAEYVAIAEARLNGTQRGLGLVG